MLNGMLFGAVSQQTVVMIVVLVLLFGMSYFTSIKPQQKQAKIRSEMLSSLKKGDEIVTVGGFYGTVKSVKDDRLVIELAPDKIKAEIRKESVLNKIEKPGEVPEEDEYELVYEDEGENKEKDN